MSKTPVHDDVQLEEPKKHSLEETKNFVKDRKKLVRGLIILAIAIVVAIILLNILPYDPVANRGITIGVFIGILWLTEAFPLPLTGLMVPVLAAFSGVMGTEEAFAGFADPIIFLLMGGFGLAATLKAQGIDQYLANKVFAISRGRVNIAVYLLFGMTAFLSMWINNASATLIFLPLGLSILSHLNPEKDRKTYVFLILGIAYCASIGGMGTLIGTGTNGVAAKAIDNLGGEQMDFARWMGLGMPLVLIMLPLMVITLKLILRPKLNFTIHMYKQQSQKFTWTPHRILAVTIFVFTIILWLASKQINGFFESIGIGEIKSINALIAVIALLLVVLTGCITWKDVEENIEWGLLILFGGGLTLAEVFSASNASGVLGKQIAQSAEHLQPFIIILIVATVIMILTEFTSNLASAALLIPIFGAAAGEMGIPSEVIILVIGFGASMAYMLPVGTPPNAIAFGTGYVPQRIMILCGGALTLISIIFVSCWAYFVWMPIFG